MDFGYLYYGMHFSDRKEVRNMPTWYEKYNEILTKCKNTTRCNAIHLWHEETLARLRARLMDLKVQKIRTRLSGKRI